MDLRKLKTLIDLVSDSNVSELEITEAEGKVRIVKSMGVAAPVVMQQAAPVAVASAPVGALQFRAQVSDAAGNVSYSNALPLTVDGAGVPVPVVGPAAGNDVIDAAELAELAADMSAVLFSGTAYSAASRAAEILRASYGIAVDLWSATSYKSLRDDAVEVERWNRLHPTQAPRTSTVAAALGGHDTPVVAVTDFMRIVPEQIASFVPNRTFLALGTDGMGRSDTREALRRYFETDAEHVVVAVLSTLVGRHGITRETVAQAIIDLGINPEAENGLTRD